MKLIFTPAALKSLTKIPAKDRAVLLADLQLIAANPSASHAAVKKMTGHPGFRMRHGNWRAVYVFEADEIMRVVKVGHRSEVYR